MLIYVKKRVDFKTSPYFPSVLVRLNDIFLNLGWTCPLKSPEPVRSRAEVDTLQPRCSFLEACFLLRVSDGWLECKLTSPLDGAVVGTRERWGGGGRLACTLTSIKTVISQPVCALTDHSKHYAQHRGWTTLRLLDWNEGFLLLLLFSATPRRAETMRDKLHCRFLTPLNVVSSHVGCCAHISVSCLVHIIPRVSCAPAPLPIVFSCLMSPPPHKEKKKKRERKACARSLREIRSSGWLGSLLWRKRASRRAWPP